MPLCDYFLATDAELSSLAESGSPSDGLTRVDAKGFDVLPIEALAKRLGVGRAAAEGKPDIHSDDFEWFVQRLTTGMVAALASQSDAACAEHARALTEAGVTDWDPSDLGDLLRELSAMARRTEPEGRSLFMWIST